MEKETVLTLLLLKPMTKTSELNDIAIMTYMVGALCKKKSIPFFGHYYYYYYFSCTVSIY